MVWPAIIAAAAALGGAALSNKGAKKRNKRQIKQAQAQMAFQERMSNTAVSRRMADLKNSGINPILAGQYSASSPSGAQAAIQDEMTPAVNSAISAAQTSAQMRNLAAQTRNTSAQANIQKLTYERLKEKPELIDSQYGLTGQASSAMDLAGKTGKKLYDMVDEPLADVIDSTAKGLKTLEKMWNDFTSQSKRDAARNPIINEKNQKWYTWPDGSARMYPPDDIRE